MKAWGMHDCIETGRMREAGLDQVDVVEVIEMLNVAEIFDGKRFNTLGVVGRGLKQPSIPGV